MDTIYALASAPGKAGVALIRVSGPAAHDAVEALSGSIPPDHRAALRTLRGRDGEAIDKALVLVFPEGRSFTGEAVAEFHVHGGRATIAAVLGELAAIQGLRIAEPGEFTRRALENGRLDLTEVEGLADLIDAETEAQRKQAMRVFDGALGKKVGLWREALVRAMALLAVTIDFSEEDVPDDVAHDVLNGLTEVRSGIAAEISGMATAERIRDGFEVAIVGPPNIGKSTLLNALAGRDAALTSDIAGTTRDVIEVRMDLNGLPVSFLDTAGLRETSDAIEKMGIARALKRAAAADIRVVLVEAGRAPMIELHSHDLVLIGKQDAPGNGEGVSGLTGNGIDRVLAKIEAYLSETTAQAGLITRERHMVAMKTAIAGLHASIDQVSSGTFEVELVSEDLRRVVLALDSLIGKVDVEDLLDSIFSSFCIGK